MLGEAMSILARRRAGAVGKLTGFHPPKEVQVFGHIAIAKRRILARPVRRTAIRFDVGRGEIANVGFALLDQRHGIVVKLVEIIRRVKRFELRSG